MLFNSLHFLAFFPIVCVAYFALPWLRARNLFLLGASYYFYMNWQPAYALLLLTSTLVTYLAALGIEGARERRAKKLFLAAALALNLGMLFAFKYYNFAASQLTLLLRQGGLDMSVPQLGVLLPVGISFYIFQALGYSIDVYRGHTPAERHLPTYALFVSFFPQLVAGPIERSTHLLGQFRHKHPPAWDNAMAGLEMMAWGYFLKLAMADQCALYIDSVYEALPFHGGGSCLLATLLFPFQIYGDFGGYSLIAMGAARVMGFRLMTNFRQPYFATSVSHFWRRWHISLSSWLKDYVYIPLGGSRVGKARAYANLMVTFLVSGFWHGANWTFLLWGILHGGMLCLEKALGWTRAKWSGLSLPAHWALTFVFCTLVWVFFRAPSVEVVCQVFGKMLTDIDAPRIGTARLVFMLVPIVVVCAKDWADARGLALRGWFARHLAIALLAAYVLLLGVLDHGQFIYFQF